MNSTQHPTAPRVTIGIPAYNCADFVASTVRSALEQDFDDFEVLIIDDCSTDETPDVLASFDDPRVRVLRNEPNLGQAGTHNRIFEEARGEYLKLLHADDLIEPDAVSTHVAALDANPGVVLVSSRRRIMDEQGHSLFVHGPRWPEGVIEGSEVLCRIVRHGANLIGEPSAVTVRTAAAREVGGFVSSIRYAVDLQFWVDVLELGDLYFIPRPLMRYRVRGGSVTATEGGGNLDELEGILRGVAADPRSGVTESDVAEGMRHARRNHWLRSSLTQFVSIPAGHREKLRYVIAGGWNTLFGYLMFVMFWTLFGATQQWPYWLVLTASYAVSVCMTFTTQKLFVFRSKGPVWREFPKFVSVWGIVLVVNLVWFPTFVHWLGLNAYVAQALFTVASVVVTYIANKYFSFSQAAVES